MRTLLLRGVLVPCFALLASCAQPSSPELPTQFVPAITPANARIHEMPPLDRRLGYDLRPHTGQLQYHGGPVQTTPSIYVVFWGFHNNDPSHQAQRQLAFLAAVGGSQWLSTLGQYYQRNPTGNIVNTNSQLKGTWYDDADPVPQHPSDASVAAEAVRAAAHFLLDANASYVIDTPQGNATPGFGTKFCAYHGAVSAYGALVAYTNFPYMTDGGKGCGAHSVNRGNGGLLDGVSIIAGHELAETQTDPNAVSGWIDWTNEEVADKCVWLNLKNTSFGASGKFPTQPLWSNSLPGCAQ